MSAAKPSLELLRALSDTHVLEALVDARRATRAELAASTGISKPTVAESVRRLAEAGVVVDTGERTTGPGRVGTFFGLAPGVGLALAVAIAPDGVVVRALDVHGDVLAEQTATVTRPARPRDVATSLRTVARRVARTVGAPVRLAVVSAADPVGRADGRLVHLPDAPFLIGDLAPVDVLRSVVEGPVTVDNDVNWAARAELAVTPEVGDACYLHLGEGLGAAVVSDGEVRRGAAGFAGEVSHVVTAGPGGLAMPFTEVFARLGVRVRDSAAVDVAAVLALLAGPERAAVGVVAGAVAGVVAAAVGLVDPAVVVLGGEWGTHPALVAAVHDVVTTLARPVPVRPATVVDAPALTGASAAAVTALRRHVVDYRSHPA